MGRAHWDSGEQTATSMILFPNESIHQIGFAFNFVSFLEKWNATPLGPLLCSPLPMFQPRFTIPESSSDEKDIT